jgi:hypothetical protein
VIRSATVDGEDIRSSGLVNGGLMSIRRGAVVECKWTDSPTMDCPDVCLEAIDCKNGSECWKIATRGPVGRIL